LTKGESCTNTFCGITFVLARRSFRRLACIIRVSCLKESRRIVNDLCCVEICQFGKSVLSFLWIINKCKCFYKNIFYLISFVWQFGLYFKIGPLPKYFQDSYCYSSLLDLACFLLDPADSKIIFNCFVLTGKAQLIVINRSFVTV
jgi:hypothetical protein